MERARKRIPSAAQLTPSLGVASLRCCLERVRDATFVGVGDVVVAGVVVELL